MTTSTLLKLPVISFRRITNPSDSDGKACYIAVVNVKDVPESLEDWRGLNPRDPNINSGVAHKIMKTLQDNPASFFFRNRGITIMAVDTRFDNKTNLLEMEMVDKQKHGLLDGGHTFRVIREFVENLPKSELTDFEAFVKIEIIVGITDLEEAVSIVEALNTSTQVREQSLLELSGSFESIKKVLADKPYANRIAYKEYELLEDGSKKDIDIKELLSYLICFDIGSYDQSTHPIGAYSTKTAVVTHFKDHEKEMKKLIPLLPKILELRDAIYCGLPEAYNAQGGKFGHLTGVIEVTNRRMGKTPLVFVGGDSNYRIPSGFIYPVLAAFRNLVACNSENCSWKTDPIRFFQELKESLAVLVGTQAKELRNPNKLGKDAGTWTQCYQAVRIAVLERSL
ncbi:MAG: AIPR family protein [Patescibacteria group bacterium]